jgi:hypothetical protein
MSKRVFRRRDGKDYLETRDAIAAACDAILLRAVPRLRSDVGSQAFALRAGLKGLIWNYSEQTSIPGDKYQSCPFWSEDAYVLWKDKGKSAYGDLTLEHVFPREEAEEELRRATTAEQIRAVLDKLETCTILQKEHGCLTSTKLFKHDPSKPGDWWQRYRFGAASIRIRKGPFYEKADPNAVKVFEKRWAEIDALQSWAAR